MTTNHAREIEFALRPEILRQARRDMHDEPSEEAIHREVAYRWDREVSAMKNLNEDELYVCWKNDWKPSEYLESRDR